MTVLIFVNTQEAISLAGVYILVGVVWVFLLLFWTFQAHIFLLLSIGMKTKVVQHVLMPKDQFASFASLQVCKF